jgi:SAM-dependent methyltransferase
MKGIEIGAAAHNDFGVHAINIDRYGSMNTTYKQHELQACGRKRAVDIVAAGDDLPFGDKSVDYVLASHVLKHFPDPIRAITEWVRVARQNVVVVPHRDRTFDRDRGLTSISEVEGTLGRARYGRGVRMNTARLGLSEIHRPAFYRAAASPHIR